MKLDIFSLADLLALQQHIIQKNIIHKKGLADLPGQANFIQQALRKNEQTLKAVTTEINKRFGDAGLSIH